MIEEWVIFSLAFCKYTLFFLHAYLSVFLYIYQSVCVSVIQSVCVCFVLVDLSTCLYFCLSAKLCQPLHFCLPVSLFCLMFICLSNCLPVILSAIQSMSVCRVCLYFLPFSLSILCACIYRERAASFLLSLHR